MDTIRTFCAFVGEAEKRAARAGITGEWLSRWEARPCRAGRRQEMGCAGLVWRRGHRLGCPGVEDKQPFFAEWEGVGPFAVCV